MSGYFELVNKRESCRSYSGEPVKRELIEKTNLDWHHAAPGGDVMMTGTVGLVKTIQERL